MKDYNLRALLIVIPLVVIVGVCFYLIFTVTNVSGKDLGISAVKYMYNFQTLNELDDNMDALREITTEEVYESLTIDRTDRTLSVYLKFNNRPVVVEIEEATDNYVVYKLHTDSISSFRKFVFFFEVGKDGKINKVRESELIDFSTNT